MTGYPEVDLGLESGLVLAAALAHTFYDVVIYSGRTCKMHRVVKD